MNRNPKHRKPFLVYPTLASRSCRLGGSWLAGFVAVSLARRLDSSPSWPVSVWSRRKSMEHRRSARPGACTEGPVEGTLSSNGERTHIQGAIGCNKYMRHGQVANLALCQRQRILVPAELFHLMFGTHQCQPVDQHSNPACSSGGENFRAHQNSRMTRNFCELVGLVGS